MLAPGGSGTADRVNVSPSGSLATAVKTKVAPACTWWTVGAETSGGRFTSAMLSSNPPWADRVPSLTVISTE